MYYRYRRSWNDNCIRGNSDLLFYVYYVSNYFFIRYYRPGWRYGIWQKFINHVYCWRWWFDEGFWSEVFCNWKYSVRLYSSVGMLCNCGLFWMEWFQGGRRS